MAKGECRTEVVRPKGSVVMLFHMQNFISCVHLACKSTPTMNVCLRVLDSEDKRNSRFFSIKRRSSLPRMNGPLSPTLHRQSQEI